MDDMLFPSYSSSKARSRQTQFGESKFLLPNAILIGADLCPVVGDAFVRELDVSKITLRLRAKEDKKGEGNSDATIAKLTGSTLDTLRRCLVSVGDTRHLESSNLWLLVQTY